MNEFTSCRERVQCASERLWYLFAFLRMSFLLFLLFYRRELNRMAAMTCEVRVLRLARMLCGCTALWMAEQFGWLVEVRLVQWTGCPPCCMDASHTSVVLNSSAAVWLCMRALFMVLRCPSLIDSWCMKGQQQQQQCSWYLQCCWSIPVQMNLLLFATYSD